MPLKSDSSPEEVLPSVHRNSPFAENFSTTGLESPVSKLESPVSNMYMESSDAMNISAIGPNKLFSTPPLNNDLIFSPVLMS